MPEPAEPTPLPQAERDVDEELLVAIQRLGRLMGSRQVAGRIAGAAGAEVSQQGVQLIRSLHRHGEQPIARLAVLARMDVAAVSRQLRPLEQAALITRMTHVDDARVTLVSLTEDGSQLAQRIRSVGLRHLSDALGGWSRQDRARLAGLLGRLTDDFARTEVIGPLGEPEG